LVLEPLQERSGVVGAGFAESPDSDQAANGIQWTRIAVALSPPSLGRKRPRHLISWGSSIDFPPSKAISWKCHTKPLALVAVRARHAVRRGSGVHRARAARRPDEPLVGGLDAVVALQLPGDADRPHVVCPAQVQGRVHDLIRCLVWGVVGAAPSASDPHRRIRDIDLSTPKYR